VADYGALLVAYIILNKETVGLFVYDEGDGAYVHHQFITSRVERCLLAHAVEISAPFLQSKDSIDVAELNKNTSWKLATQHTSDIATPMVFHLEIVAVFKTLLSK